MLSDNAGERQISECLKIISSQFQVLQTRSQLLLTLSTLTLTITGFSGPKIASTNHWAQGTMALGIVLVLVATILILLGTLRVSWVSQMGGTDAIHRLTQIIEYRNLKTRLYRWQLFLLVLGLGFYVASVLIYLLVGL